MNWRTVALCLTCWAFGFAGAWGLRADQTADARSTAHAADLTQEGASRMVDGLSQQLDVCELGLQAAGRAIEECGQENVLLQGRNAIERVKLEKCQTQIVEDP